MGFLTLVLTLQAMGQVFDQGTTADRLTVLEAESGTPTNVGTDAWQLVHATTTPPAPTTPQSFVGTGAMSCLPNNGGGNNDNATGFVNGSRLAFRCLFRAAGTYYVWVRGRAFDDSTATPAQAPGDNDSCHVGLNGVAAATGYQVTDFPATQWQWSRARNGGNASISVPTVGVHTFFVYMREDGFMVDRVLITANSGYTGVTQDGVMNGPAASAQIADQTPAAATAPVVVGGSFRIDVTWAAVTNAETYVLERSVNGGAWTEVFSGAGRAYSEENFNTTQDSCFRVRGVDGVFGNGPVSPAACGRASLPPPRVDGNEEGLLGENCACGSTVTSTPWAFAFLLPLLLTLRRRR